jgi:Flp pilus assembly protein TadG
MRRCRHFWADRKSVAAVEFALIGPFYFMIIFGILGVSLVMWAKGTLQVAAAQTARCTAIGSSACVNPQAFSASILSAWGAANFLPSLSVVVQSGVTCNNTAGHFSMVTITGLSNGVLGLGGVLPSGTLTATACYPSAM